MLAAIIAACAGDMARHDYVKDYETVVAQAELPAIDAASLPDGPARFLAYLDNFSADTVANRTMEVYAEDAYLNDTLKTIRGNDEIREYFVETFTKVEALEASVVEVSGSGKSWFFRWQMTMQFEDLNDGEPAVSVGVSHIIFDDEGRVKVHQDYWDAASHFFVMVPIAGKIITRVKNGL